MSIVSSFRMANGEYYLNGGYCKRLKQLGYQNRKEKLEKLLMMKIFLDQHRVLVWTTRNKSRWFRHFLGPCFNQSTLNEPEAFLSNKLFSESCRRDNRKKKIAKRLRRWSGEVWSIFGIFLQDIPKSDGKMIPSREMSHIPPRERENHLQNALKGQLMHENHRYFCGDLLRKAGKR